MVQRFEQGAIQLDIAHSRTFIRTIKDKESGIHLPALAIFNASENFTDQSDAVVAVLEELLINIKRMTLMLGMATGIDPDGIDTEGV